MTHKAAELADRARVLRDTGMAQAAIAARLGISQSRVSQLLTGKTGNEARQHRKAETVTSQPAETVTSQPAETVTSQPAVFVRSAAARAPCPDCPGKDARIAELESALARAARAEADVALIQESYDELEAENARLREHITALESPP